MGNVRTPRPHYFEHGVIEYYVEDKEMYYKVKVWNKDGTKQFCIDNAKLKSKTPEQILKDLPLQSFSSVVRT